MKGAWIAASLALLAAGAQAAPASREALSEAESRGLLEGWAKDLALLDSGKDLAAFWKSHPVDVRVDQRVASMGLYEGGKLFVNQGYLIFRLEALEAKGLRGDAAVRALSWVSLHAFAHELQHAATHARMQQELGFQVSFPDRDDELISISRETRMIQEIAAKKPELLFRDAFTIDDERETDTFIRARGLKGAEIITDSMFASLPRIRTEDPARLRAKCKAQIDGADAALAQLDKDLPANAPPEALEYDRMRRDDPLRQKAMGREILAVLDAPSRYRALRDFYQRRYDELKAASPK